MKSENIIKRLKKEGYKITYKKWSYWDGIPHVELDGFDFAIAEMRGKNSINLNLDFIYNEVLSAISSAKRINKSHNYKILSMNDYYLYKKRKYPFDDIELFWNK